MSIEIEFALLKISFEEKIKEILILSWIVTDVY